MLNWILPSKGFSWVKLKQSKIGKTVTILKMQLAFLSEWMHMKGHIEPSTTSTVQMVESTTVAHSGTVRTAQHGILIYYDNHWGFNPI